MDFLYGFLFFSGIFVLLTWSILGLSKTSSEIHSKLDYFKEQAEKANTKEELKEIYKNLIQYHKEKCIIRHYGEHARKVGYYIEGKYQGLSK